MQSSVRRRGKRGQLRNGSSVDRGNLDAFMDVDTPALLAAPRRVNSEIREVTRSGVPPCQVVTRKEETYRQPRARC